jgi:hypothetical protein
MAKITPDEELLELVALVNDALRKNHKPPGVNLSKGEEGAIRICADAIGMNRTTFQSRIYEAERRGIGPDYGLYKPKKRISAEIPVNEIDDDEDEPGKPDPHVPQAAYLSGPSVELVSGKDNRFVFLAFGDLHAGSKYCRWDVREDLIRQAEARGAQAAFDTGNWIDGVASFNRYDLDASGMSAQCRMLAEKHPKTRMPIYAVTGDDHEGWYAQREGVDIGRYCENVMREAGHNWTDLGYMEAHVRLVNANTGKSQVLAVQHPGGGSAYAISYRPQKIIESFEGGEKPAVILLGHYHKLEAGNARNVWYCQTGCAQDQTPFMRKKSIEAHVGGAIITLTQDPNTGAIIGMEPAFFRYFNRDYYNVAQRWSHHGPVGHPPRSR